MEPASGVKASVKAGSDNVLTAAAALTSTLLYWFPGTNLTATGMRAQWKSVNGGTCMYRETKLNENDSILSDAVYKRPTCPSSVEAQSMASSPSLAPRSP